MTKFESAGTIKHAWDKSAKVKNAVNGFRDSGLFPFYKYIVLKTDKLQTSKLFACASNDSDSASICSTSTVSCHDREQELAESVTNVSEYAYSLPSDHASATSASVASATYPSEIASNPPSSPSPSNS